MLHIFRQTENFRMDDKNPFLDRNRCFWRNLVPTAFQPIWPEKRTFNTIFCHKKGVSAFTSSYKPKQHKNVLKIKLNLRISALTIRQSNDQTNLVPQ